MLLEKGTVRAVGTFRELSEAERQEAGGKGGTLAYLYQHKYPVPDGLVILPFGFAGDRLSEEAWMQARACLRRLRRAVGNTAFAVRSSALSEDSARASFAGEFETVLSVRSDEEIRAAINTVRSSRNSERVKAYSQAQGIPAVHEMAVTVQRMIPAEIAGVLFTADPVAGDRNRMVGNYVHGLGDKLVSGESESIDFTIERLKYKYNGPSELERFARRFYKLATRLEKELGCPQDIEWAISENSLYILQSRPITTMIGFNPVTGESNDSLTGDYAWSCVNIGEGISVVMTPFTWSMVRNAFHEFDVIPGYSIIGNIGGRPYGNITVAISMGRALGKLGKNLEDSSREISGVFDEYLEQMVKSLVPLPGASFLTILANIVPVLIKWIKGLRNTAAFVADNPGWCRAMCRRIQDIETSTEMASLWVNEVNPYVLRAFHRVVATAARFGSKVGRLRPALLGLAGAADAEVLLTPVSSRSELLESLGPVVGLSRVAHGQMSREAYLEKWGHRGALEAEASTPRLFEDPDWLDRALAAFNQSPVDVAALLAAQLAEFDAAWERLWARHPRRASGVRRRLDSPEDGDKLEPGEILVASQTNIGWTLLFPRAGGIVTDIGAPLSHAAVVARELGIPAVVNCGNATMRLHTGDKVWVDGTKGIVEVLETKIDTLT
ncbi:MAG: hypothetical protein HY670_04180 [Chloroflexi bacterium]|nr:hypothetical protein [Chloroflexota bacterium]